MSYVSPCRAVQKILNHHDTSWSENNVSVCTLCAFSFASREENACLIPLATARFWRLNMSNQQLKSISVTMNLKDEVRHWQWISSFLSTLPETLSVSLSFYFIVITLLRRCWGWLFVKVSSWKMVLWSCWGRDRGTAAHIGCRCAEW